MQLKPQSTFTIVRQIEDHTDPTAYYVRAEVRKAQTDELLATVDLVNRGDNRYSMPYQVPADVSGQGYIMVITTSVYTDSGHTTKSGNYGDRIDTYLVHELWNPNFGNGGGADVDYKKVRKIVQEELGKIDKPEPKTVVTEVVKEVKIPQIVKVESTREIVREVKVPKIVKLESVKEVVKKIEVESSVDLSQLTKMIEECMKMIEEMKPKPVVSPMIQDKRIGRLLKEITSLDPRTVRLKS